MTLSLHQSDDWTNRRLVYEYKSKLPFRYQRAIRRADGRVSDDDDAEAEDDDGLGINDRSLLLGESLTASYRIRGRRRNISPESVVSLWSKLTFSWPYRLLRQGTRSGILNSG